MDEGGETKGKNSKRIEVLEEVGADWKQAYDGKGWKEIVLGTKSLNGS